MSLRRILQIAGTLVCIGSLLLTPHTAARANGSADPLAIQLEFLGRASATGAEISAYDPASKRLFVTGEALQIFDLSSPASPTLVTSLPYNATSVAIRDGLVAVAVPAPVVQDPGQVVFLDVNGAVLNTVTVGALPDMLTFTPDGARVLVANEGEPAGANDPEGSVSVISLAGGAANATVATAGFGAFNSQRARLAGQGVRLFPSAASVAQDLEPEYIAVAPDGATAWVTLQEANAVAVLDIAQAAMVRIVPLGLKDHSRGLPVLSTYAWTDRPSLGHTAPSAAYPAGQEFRLGGFSGLFYEGEVDGKLQFVTHPDRGPNGEPTNLLPAIAGNERPFPLPNFQPEIVRFTLDRATGEIAIVERIGLKRADGTPLTGLPNLQAATAGLAYTDETPIDLFGNLLPLDPFGGDLEGVVVAPDGHFWMVDEYRPAIYHFDPTGTLVARFVPQGTAAAVGQPAGAFGTEALPAVYAQRRANRGFEAVALEGGKLYAFIQSPVDNPDSANDAASRASLNLRVVEFDVAAASVTAEYLYQLNDISGTGVARTDKLGDAVALGGGRFLVLERDDRTGLEANKLIYEIDLKGATNVLGLAAVGAKTPEQATAEELAAAGVRPVFKRLVTNLGPLGYVGVSKPEGLALVDADTVAVINDNDFGVLAEAIPGDGTVPVNSAPEPILLGVVDFTRGAGLDASDRDGPADGPAINIRNWPVLGQYMPDAIASVNAASGTYYLTANEGDARGEDRRIGTLTLDPTAFPNAAALRQNAALGRLNASSLNGDVDGDGDYDRLYTYGARSFTVWDAFGNLVWDSGDALEQITAAQTPTLFNANDGAAARVDQRSDDKGPEPEGVTIGRVGYRTYAFVGLERAGGGVMVYDLTDPRAPVFVTYVRADGDISPEGLTFVPADRSPNGQALLILTHEVSNTITVYGVKPVFSVVDGFARRDGRLRSADAPWLGTVSGYRLSGQQVDVLTGGALYWNQDLGEDQAASVVLTQVQAPGAGVHHSVLLKVQTTWQRGAIAVFFDGAGQVGVETFVRGRGWRTLATWDRQLINGDQLGGRALADGTVQVYVNDALVGVTQADAFFANKGGLTGLWFINAGDAWFDDFAAQRVMP